MASSLPAEELLAEYIEIAMRSAVFEILCDGTHYAETPGFQGVWSNADSREKCREELKEVLEDWIILGIELGHTIPILPSIELIPQEHWPNA